jgi:putative PIN family toxin of toxin-antitoxin system
MIGVVVDTNVLVSANLKPEGLEAKVVRWVLNRQAQLFLSEPILSEYERVLHYIRPSSLCRRKSQPFFGWFAAWEKLISPTHTLTECLHEADNRFLECAEAAQADYLVTSNQRHFPKAWEGTGS